MTLEDLVLAETYHLLDDQRLLDYIADKTWELYQKQDEDQAETGTIRTAKKG